MRRDRDNSGDRDSDLQPRRRDGRDGRALWFPNPDNIRAKVAYEFQRAVFERWLPELAIDELCSFPHVWPIPKWPGSQSPTPGAIELTRPWREWAERWNIRAPGILDNALYFTHEWHASGKRLRRNSVRSVYVGTCRGQPPYRRIETIDNPMPNYQSRNEYLEMAGRAWDARAQTLRALGYKPCPPTIALSVQCEWTARRRVLGASLAELATEHRGGGIDTVSKAIRKIETILHLHPLNSQALKRVRTMSGSK